MRIAIDMDEVLADAHAGQRKLYAALGVTLTDIELRGRKLRDAVPAVALAEVETQMHQGAFFANLDMMPGALAALKRLCKDHDVWVISAAMEYPASCVHKIAWMQRHFPFFDISHLVLCGDKSIIRADVLIDDHARHFEGFCGHGLLFNALHNANVDWPQRLPHWDHVHTTLQEMHA